MQRVVIEDFYRELDATDEGYVRKKLATGGYAGWKAKHAKHWLEERATKRAEQREAGIVRWTKFGALATLASVVMTIVLFWLR